MSSGQNFPLARTAATDVILAVQAAAKLVTSAIEDGRSTRNASSDAEVWDAAVELLKVAPAVFHEIAGWLPEDEK